jgi:hypothetical protein
MLVVRLVVAAQRAAVLETRDPAVTYQLIACLKLTVERLHRTVVAPLQLIEKLVHGL